jgi:hypothetical protein
MSQVFSPYKCGCSPLNNKWCQTIAEIQKKAHQLSAEAEALCTNLDPVEKAELDRQWREHFDRQPKPSMMFVCSRTR